MSLLQALTATRSSIQLTQASMDVVARNIANATTEGYTKKTQEQTTRIISGESQGVRLEEVTRSIDAGLQRDLREETANAERLTVMDDFLGRLNILFGRPEDAKSIASKITDLKDAFQQLSTTPNLATAQEEVVRAAERVVTEFNQMSADIQALRGEIDARVDDSVTLVNQSLTNIDNLNGDILKRSLQGESTSDLEDLRDLELMKISKEMNVRSFFRSDGSMTVLTGASQLMLDQAPYPLEFTPTASVAPDVALNPVRMEDGLATPATNPSISSDITSGRIAGYLELRDTILPEAQDQLDALAFELAEQLATISSINGTAGNDATLNLFVIESTQLVPTANQGFSATIGVRDAIASNPDLLRDPGAGGFTANGTGDGSLPLAVLDVFETNQTFATGTGLTGTDTFLGFAAQLIGYQANQKADIENQLTFQNQFRDSLMDRFNDQSGVNIDEELSRLVELENAFAASARVLTAVQRALDELLAAVR